MSSNAAIQQYINTSSDPALAVYAADAQAVPITTGNSTVYITNVNEYTINNISSPGKPGGNTTEVQFNLGGAMEGDNGLTYNPTTDSLTVIGNLTAGTVLTNSLKYANGVAWNFSGSSYGNSNVAGYLPTYVGNLTPNVVTASLFSGNGASLTNIPAGNIVGTVASATTASSATSATTAATVTTAAQPNITSLGTIVNLTVTGNISAGRLQGEGGNISNIQGANVSGTVANSTNSTNATFAGTVTTAAQPNITSVGTLNGITATGTLNFTGAGNVSLGPIGNVRITGGTNGQVLSTNGSGVLSWSTPSTGNLQDVTTNGGTTNQTISVTNTTDSTSFSVGAVTISGGLGVAKAIHTNMHVAAKDTIYAGQYADFSSWVIPKFIGRDAGSTYIQGALINTNENGSADWVAYNDSSPTDGSEGWADMGYTGSTFSDPLYTITKANDGYVFVQGINATDGGNFVLATGSLGQHHDLIFATGGFLEANEAMRLDHERDTFFVGGHAHTGLSDRVIDLDVNGNVTISGNFIANASASPAPNINGFSSATFTDSLTAGDITISNNLINTNSSATSLLLSANYPASSNALIEIPNFLDGGEKLTIRNDFTNSNGIDIQTSGGIWTFTATGNLTVPGSIIPSANVSYDLGNSTNRFRDLYLSGTTIDLGGTLIQAQANGQVSIGNATFSSSGKISAADVSIDVIELNANTTAILGHAGSMLTYGNVGGGILYYVPNNATTPFSVGSRIELLALSQATIIVEVTPGSGVTLITSKDLNTNDPTLSNIQSAKLTKIATDTWYLGL